MSACPVCALPEGHAGFCTFSEFDPPDAMPSIGRNQAAAPVNVPAVPRVVPGAVPGSWIPSAPGLSIVRRREAYGFAAAGLRHAAASFARSPSSWVPTPEVVDRAGKALALCDARKPDAARFNSRGAIYRELGFAGRYDDARCFALTVARQAFRQAIDHEVPRHAKGKPDLFFNWEKHAGRSVDEVVAKLRVAADLCDAEVRGALEAVQ